MVTYKLLHDVKHEDYDAVYWRKIHALYAGMSVMRNALQDKQVRETLFPRHLGEEEWVYNERLKRVFYIPYMGQLIDYITASLAADPIRMSEDEAEGSKTQGGAQANKVMMQGKVNGDTFYDQFSKDCSPPGGDRMSFNQLIRQQVTNALLYRRAWTLVEMPSMEEDGPTTPKSRYEELKTIGDGCYCCPVDPECVYDWECDDDGELLWALVCRVERKRLTLDADRKMVREEYTYYTQDSWTRYVYEYDPDKNPPKPEQVPDSTETGPHSFTRVPLIPFELPDGLWAGGKIESIACEHFNKRNALSWAEYRSLFQFLAVKLQEPSALNPISEDPDRAVSQPIGPGRVMRLSEKDTVEYVSPEAEPFKIAMEDLAVLRDEMFRLLNMMAMSVDNTGSALKRSADSKQVDNQSTSIVLKDLGRRGREHGEDIFEMVARGRGEGDKQFTAQGMDQFDEVSMDSLVNEAALLETVPIPSQTFQALYKFELARRALPGATEDQLATIMQELKDGITAEAEIQKATQDAQQDRIEQGVLPGETPPEQAPEPPKSKKAKK